MNSLIISILAISIFATNYSIAATDQQNKMVTCNKDATGKKGDERKAFMKECLSNKPEAAAEAPKNTQQNKMVTCNKEATGKKGEERKKFMSECLKAK